MAATLIPIGLILGFLIYLLYCWWVDRNAPCSRTPVAEEVHFNPYLYTHAKQICAPNNECAK